MQGDDRDKCNNEMVKQEYMHNRNTCITHTIIVTVKNVEEYRGE